MHCRLEFGERRGPHPLRRGTRGDQVRVLGLDVAQLVEERVVVGVRDLRLVVDVVERSSAARSAGLLTGGPVTRGLLNFVCGGRYQPVEVEPAQLLEHGRGREVEMQRRDRDVAVRDRRKIGAVLRVV
jgi:hypothetical protein